MPRILTRVVILLLIGGLGATAWGAADDPRSAIEAANKAFMQAFARGDVATRDGAHIVTVQDRRGAFAG